MPSLSRITSLMIAGLLFCSSGLWAQETFTGGEGFPVKLRGTDMDIRIPGSVWTNGRFRFSVPGIGQACIAPYNDAGTIRPYIETDCDGVFEGGTEFVIGTGGAGGVASGLDANFDIQPFIDGADSLVNALRVGNGVVDWGLYCTGTTDCFMGGSVPADIALWIDPGKKFILRDVNAAADILSVDPAATSPNEMWAIGTAYQTLASSEVVLRPLLGSDCTAADQEIVTGEGVDDWITCADTVGDGVNFRYITTTKIATDADAKLTLYAVNKNAALTGAFTLTCAIQSKRVGVDAFTAHSQTGEQPISFTSMAQNVPQAVSATISINGFLDVGAIIKGQCNLTSVPTQIADIRLLGVGMIELSANSFSD